MGRVMNKKDAQNGMHGGLIPRAQNAFKDSMICRTCGSHHVSHFTAFFIDTGAKGSIAVGYIELETLPYGL